MELVTGVASILVGGGLLAFIQFLINRHDKRNDRFKEIHKMIEKLSEKIDALDKKGDERNAISARVRILRFADEMQANHKHSKDSWDQCMADITEYEKYCEKEPEFKNNQTAMTIEYLETNYQERLAKHDFL